MILAVGGTELSNSRRIVDLFGFEASRVQFQASATISVRVEYSLDGGATWNTLIAEGTEYGGNPYVSEWQTMPPEALDNDVLIRALAIGFGLLTSVDYVEFQFR